MKPKNFIFVVLLAALLPSTALVAINVITDPYNEFGNRDIVAKPLVETVRTEKLDLLKSDGAEFEALVLGSSRMMEINPDELGYKGFNFSVNSAMPEDFYAQVKWLEMREILPQRVLIGVDLNMFNNAIPVEPRLVSARQLFSLVQDDPAMESLYDMERDPYIVEVFWRKYLSRNMLQDSIDAIDANNKNLINASDTLKNGMLLRRRDLATRQESGWRIDENKDLRPYMNEKFSGYDALSEERIDLFEKTLKVLDREGVQVWIVLTSYHPMILEKIYMDDDLMQRLNGLRQLLLKSIENRKKSWLYFDATDVSAIDCRKEEMWDIVHLMPECASKLVKAVMVKSLDK